jgi:hypothetical protein
MDAPPRATPDPPLLSSEALVQLVEKDPGILDQEEAGEWWWRCGGGGEE